MPRAVSSSAPPLSEAIALVDLPAVRDACLLPALGSERHPAIRPAPKSLASAGVVGMEAHDLVRGPYRTLARSRARIQTAELLAEDHRPMDRARTAGAREADEQLGRECPYQCREVARRACSMTRPVLVADAARPASEPVDCPGAPSFLAAVAFVYVASPRVSRFFAPAAVSATRASRT